MKYISIVLIALLFVAAKPAPRPQTKQQLIVVEEAQLSAANVAAVKVFGARAKNSFSVKATDKAKKAFYVASWRMTEIQRKAFAAELDAAIKGSKIVLHEIKKDSKDTARSKLDSLELERAKKEK